MSVENKERKTCLPKYKCVLALNPSKGISDDKKILRISRSKMCRGKRKYVCKTKGASKQNQEKRNVNEI